MLSRYWKHKKRSIALICCNICDWFWRAKLKTQSNTFLKMCCVFFLQAGQEDILLNQMLDCIVTPGGILVARFLANCSNGGIGGGVGGGGGGAAPNPPTHTSCTPPLAHPAPPSTTHPLVQTMNNLWLDRYRVLASTMNQSEDESGDELIDDNRRSRALLTTTIQWFPTTRGQLTSRLRQKD